LGVGSGQSGCQIAEDLMLAGRTVHIACGRAGRILRRYRGREIIEWESMAGSFEIAVEDHPKGPDVRFVPHPHLTGRDGGKTIDLRQMALDGAILHGRLLNIDDNIIEFAHDLGRVLDDIDDACQQHMTRLDKFITEQGIDAPENTQSPANWVPNGGETRLDITAANITSVIMATGFQFDFSWLDLPIFDDRGYPRYRRGVTELPGVYFCGLHWMHTAGSGLFSQVGRDAEHVTAHLLRSG
jgi:putative flavoprotein involved in K+ transport